MKNISPHKPGANSHTVLNCVFMKRQSGYHPFFWIRAMIRDLPPNGLQCCANRPPFPPLDNPE